MMIEIYRMVERLDGAGLRLLYAFLSAYLKEG